MRVVALVLSSDLVIIRIVKTKKFAVKKAPNSCKVTVLKSLRRFDRPFPFEELGLSSQEQLLDALASAGVVEMFYSNSRVMVRPSSDERRRFFEEEDAEKAKKRTLINPNMVRLCVYLSFFAY